MFCENFEGFVAKLSRLGYVVHPAADSAAAKEIALSLIGKESAGSGGSVTLDTMGLREALCERGNTVYYHGNVPKEQRAEVFAAAMRADWYLCSTNAITLDGKLVNIDGNGNRVAGMFGGPKKVLMMIGKNKLSADLDSAISRVKNCAAPANAKRLKLSTPCTITGKCEDCSSPQRICKITTVIDCPPGLIKEMHLVLVDEDLGY